MSIICSAILTAEHKGKQRSYIYL